MNFWEGIGWRGLPSRGAIALHGIGFSIVVGVHCSLFRGIRLELQQYEKFVLATIFHAAGNTTGYFPGRGINSIQSFFATKRRLFPSAIIVIVLGHPHISRSFKVVET